LHLTAQGRRACPPECGFEVALDFVTLFFGLGQAAGPSVAGAMADAMGSFEPAFLLAAGMAFLGGLGSLLRPPRTANE